MIVEHVISQNDFELFVTHDSVSYFEGKKLLGTNPSFDAWLAWGRKTVRRYSRESKLSVAMLDTDFEAAMRSLKVSLVQE